MLNDLRDRIVVQVDGQMKTGRDVVIARAARRRGVRVRDRAARGVGLHHDARLPPEHVPGRRRDAGSGAAQEVQRQAGVRRELLPVRRRGSARADGAARLPHDRRDGRPRRQARPAPGRRSLEGGGLDLSPILLRADAPARVATPVRAARRITASRQALDNELIARCRTPRSNARERGRASIPDPQRRIGRSARCSARSSTRRYGGDGLPDDTIRIHFTGSAGQSFGAFVPHGMTLRSRATPTTTSARACRAAS